MKKNLDSLGYTEMTPVQEQTLPLSLKNRDIIAKAKTGSGKTLSFAVPLLNNLKTSLFRIQAMILCPTRELANQVANELKKIARYQHNIKITTLCGGMPYRPQVHSLSHQAHIIVGTPGRILKHLGEKSFDPKDINTLVLDEADRMLDMGFNEDINKIINFIPKNRQTLLFSATYPSDIKNLAKNILTNPTTIEIEATQDKVNINQKFFQVQNKDKVNTILRVFDTIKPESTIIFCNTKIDCDNLADDLEDKGATLLVIHSDLEQRQREQTLVLFEARSYPILIATDVASRGLDIEDVDLVINYDLAFDTEVHTHRIGRTARAGKGGNAISFVTEDSLHIYDELESKETLTSTKELNENAYIPTSLWQSIYINGGKKQKIRTGDILGALTGDIGLNKEDVGKITIQPMCSYVALRKNIAKATHKKLEQTRIKGKYFKVYMK